MILGASLTGKPLGPDIHLLHIWLKLKASSPPPYIKERESGLLTYFFMATKRDSDASSLSAKRARIDVEESTKEIIESLGRVHFNNLTFEADSRELLVGVATAALKSSAGQRSSNDHALLRLLDEIFGQEEELRKSCVESCDRKTAKGRGEIGGSASKSGRGYRQQRSKSGRNKGEAC